MIEPLLRKQLEPVARRRRSWIVSRDLALCWAGGILATVLFLAIYRATGWLSSWALPVVGCAGAVAAWVVWRRSRRWEPDFRQIARNVEQQHPELHALLLTAVQQQPDATTGQLNYLQERVVREAVAKSQTGNWIDTVSDGQLFGIRAAQIAAFLGFLGLLTGLRVQTKEAVALARPTKIMVTPGDASIERGNALAVLARFEGPLPAEVTLVIRPDGQSERRIPLMKSLNDPIFGGTMSDVTNSLNYRVEYANGHSKDFKVDVFEYPRLERADAHLSFPEYTGMPEKSIQDTRRITAVEGSKLDLGLQLNKPVASARLIGRNKSIIPLVAATNRANAALEKFTLQTNQTYELQLVDMAGRTNKVPAQIIVEVLTNRAPELKFASPRGDQRVSPLQEINFQGEVWDDFGVKAYGLTYTLGAGKPQTVALGSSVPGREKRQFNHLVSLEKLGAQPDQLLSYFIWADDIGPDGQVRRTASDMYYAEVRPFEEIFRAGQSSPKNESEQEGQGNEATKLAELQKQILNATWRLQRENNVGLSDSKPAREIKPAVQPTYGKDVKVVEQSQRDALKQATAHTRESEDPSTKALWQAVEQAMNTAAGHLEKAATSPEPLPSAVEAEQGAYQALLKLAAHEFQVAQSRRGRSQSSRDQAMQREMEQLDLKQSENRYETQKQASSKLNPEQREQQQVLSRLKELAQRQQDLNERLKDLQTALQEAKTEAERQDIQRQLKRLQEEEQQMLADVDELLQRMQRPENQSRMADARQQLEQTRNQVQRASDSIEKQSVSQALSSGTRAQRQLQDLRDEFRKKNSAQFAEEMRQMRSDARDLAQKEDQVSDQLQSLGDPGHKTLSDSGQRQQLSEQMAKQTQRTTNLVEQMKRVSEEAETAEPLLSKQLYDTVRKASQASPDDSLNKAKELLDLSFFNEAGQFEQRAHKGINDVKDGVERAAESVLGDETEALRLAKNELDDLARQLDKEMAQAPNSAAQPQTGQQQSGRQPAQGQNASREQSQGQQAANGQQNQNSEQANSQGSQAQNGQDQQGQSAEQQNASGQGQRNQGNRNNQARANAQAGQRNSQTPGQNQANAQGQPNSQGQANAQGQPNSQGQSGAQGQPNQQGNAQAQANQQGNAQAQANAQGGGRGQAPGQQGQRNQATAQSGQRGGQRSGLTGQQPGQQAGSNQAAPQPGEQQQAQQGRGGPGGPITGENYTEWTDRLREVEELLDYPDLRNEVAGVRDSARSLRLDFKRNKKAPQSDAVRAKLAEPLLEVRDRISEELARRESKDALVPIDRDPVPQKFSELVRRYYEKLGSAQDNPPPERKN